MQGVDPSQLVGQVVESRYRIEAHLGSGAMGSVYRARHVRLRRAFALKLLHPRFLSDPKTLRRFEREARLAGKLSHPNVVSVVDLGEIDGRSYLVMDLAVGPRLSDLIAHGPLHPERAVRLLRQLCDGLDHAHSHGLIHRDLKPDNVIVESHGGDEVARVIDFGIAILRDSEPSGPGTGSAAEGRVTTGGLVLGTPQYMAPELATGGRFDHRVDLFALGITSFEMLTGRMPFEGTGVEIMHANIHRDPPAMAVRAPGVAVDPALETFTRRLMARQPESRFATARAARAALDRLPEVRALGTADTLAIGTLERPIVDCTTLDIAPVPVVIPEIDTKPLRRR